MAKPTTGALKLKPALKATTTPAVMPTKAAPVLKGGKTTAAKTAAKPTKVAKTALTKEAAFRVGQFVELVGYSDGGKDHMFKAGDRLRIVSKAPHEESKRMCYGAVAEDDFDAFNADNNSVNGDQFFANEIKGVEAPVVDPYAIVIPETAELKKIIKAAGGDPLTAARGLLEDTAKSTIYLGGCLAELYRGRKFQEYDTEAYADTKNDAGAVVKNSGWDAFCEANFAMNGRKGLAMISIYRNFAGLKNIDFDAISKNPKIGWVKLAAAASVVTEANAAAIIEAAETQSVQEFKSTINTEYVSQDKSSTRAAPKAKVKQTTFTFRLYEDQGVGVKHVLERAKKQLGTDDEATFEHIVMQWATEHLDGAVVQRARQLAKKQIDTLKKAGVDVTARVEAQAALDQRLGGEAA